MGFSDLQAHGIEYTQLELVSTGGGESGSVPLAYRQVGTMRVDGVAKQCASQLVEAVNLRRKYMDLSLQNFPEYLNALGSKTVTNGYHESMTKDSLKGSVYNFLSEPV